MRWPAGLKPVNERRVGGGVKQEPLEGIKLVNYVIKRIGSLRLLCREWIVRAEVEKPGNDFSYSGTI